MLDDWVSFVSTTLTKSSLNSDSSHTTILGTKCYWVSLLKRSRNRMSNSLSGNTNKRRCEYCGNDKTYMAVTKGGTPYPKWNSNPFKEETWICGRCYRHLLYRKALPPSHVRRGIRIARIAKRACYKSGGKTSTQKSESTSYDYHNWHRHPIISGKWLCARCHSNRIC